jgi:16S rRNA (guanine527-N7)-methyltransferase
VTLDAVARTFALAPGVTRALARYVDLVDGYGAANVTGVRGRAGVADRLVGDSLALLDVDELTVRAHVGSSVADIGSGAGVPGIPLALALPSLRLTLVESVGKKCLFLEQALTACDIGSRVSVACLRSERFGAPGAQGREAFAVVLARALGSLATVVELAAPLLAAGGVLLASKTGRALREEAGGGGGGGAAGGRGPPPPAPRRPAAALVPRRLGLRRLREGWAHARLAAAARRPGPLTAARIGTVGVGCWRLRPPVSSRP